MRKTKTLKDEYLQGYAVDKDGGSFFDSHSAEALKECLECADPGEYYEIRKVVYNVLIKDDGETIKDKTDELIETIGTR